jgi:hypothetical protein
MINAETMEQHQRPARTGAVQHDILSIECSHRVDPAFLID